MDGLNSSSGDGSRAIPVETQEVLEHFCSFLESWRKKTKGMRVKAQRHHLRNNILSCFEPEDVLLAIALATHERGDGCLRLSASELREQMRREMLGRSALDVIYEFPAFEDCLLSALQKQAAKRTAENQAKIEAWLKPKAA